MKIYIIRLSSTGKMVENGTTGAAFEGKDGQNRANELVEIHNRFYPEFTWFVSEETV